MPVRAAFTPVLVEYDIDVERQLVELVIRDARTRRDYCVHLPAHVFPVVRDAINTMIEDSPELFPDTKTMRAFG